MKINRNSWHYKVREKFHIETGISSMVEFEVSAFGYWFEVLIVYPIYSCLKFIHKFFPIFKRVKFKGGRIQRRKKK